MRGETHAQTARSTASRRTTSAAAAWTGYAADQRAASAARSRTCRSTARRARTEARFCPAISSPRGTRAAAGQIRHDRCGHCCFYNCPVGGPFFVASSSSRCPLMPFNNSPSHRSRKPTRGLFFSGLPRDDDYSCHTCPGRMARNRCGEIPPAFKASASATSGASNGSSVSWNVP